MVGRRVVMGIALAASVVMLAACSEDAPTAAEFPVESGTPPPAVPGIPTDDQRIRSAIDQIDARARELVDRTGIPGLALGVVYKGKTVHTAGFGVRKVGEPAKVDADTVFQIASLSKGVGATVVAQQVGNGDTISWDTPIAANLPGFALSDPYVTSNVTVADVYSHRSGLPKHAGDDLEDIGYDRAEVLRRLRYLPLAPFRTVQQYTNFGLTAGAESVALHARTDWATLSDRVLYQPAGMTSTSSRYADYVARQNKAWPHAKDTGSYESLFQREPDAQSPAGGVSSSVNDLSRWMALVLGGGELDGKRLVDEEPLTEAVTPQFAEQSGSPAFRPSAVGYGFNTSSQPSGRSSVSHSGAFYLGFGTNFQMLPSLDLGIVVLTNATPLGVAEAVSADFMDLAQYGRVTRDWFPLYESNLGESPEGDLVGKQPPANAAPARPASAYEGVYQNPYFGPLTVARDPEGLVLRIGPDNRTYQLSHWDGDTYTFELRGENAPKGTVSQVRFAMNGDRANSVWVEYWNENGLGTFTR